MYKDLKGKIAIITGASRGIGLSIAEKLAAKGSKVALVDIDRSQLEEEAIRLKSLYGDRMVMSVCCDISDSSSVQECVRKVESSLGKISILVNNAGILKRSFLEEMDEDDWGKILKVNLTGVFLFSRAVIPSMKSGGGGSIINVSSNVAAIPSVGMGAYCVTKAGIETLTKVFASELAPYNIRVNAYAPGVVSTEMTGDILKSRAEEKLRTIPLGRFGTTKDIASLVLFLCSNESSYIDGSIIPINGGMLSTQNPWKAMKKQKG